jgi:hypothetical protein
LVEFFKKIGTSQKITQLLAVNSSNFSWKKGFVDREINGPVSSALAYLRLILSNSGEHITLLKLHCQI